MHVSQREIIATAYFILTSHGSEVDKISGFRLGADDYLTKDISIEYLIVRIEALLRRYERIQNNNLQPATLTGNSNESACIHVDTERLLVYWNSQAVDLTLTQFWIVQELLTKPCKVKSYQQLMKAANIYVEANTITAHIKTIRSRFKIHDPDFNCIKTERGIGYRWLEG